MKRKTGRRKPKLLRDFAGGHAVGAGYNQQTKNRKARFMGERAQSAYNGVRVHARNDRAFISIFQVLLKYSVKPRWVAVRAGYDQSHRGHSLPVRIAGVKPR